MALEARKIKHPLLRPVRFDLSDGLSPYEAAVLAVTAHPKLKALRDEREIAAAQLLQAGILPNPQLSASYERPTGGMTTGAINAYGLQLDWEVTSLVTRGARLRGAEAQSRSVDLLVAWREWQAAEAARFHWYGLFWALKRGRVLEKDVSCLLDNLKAVEHAVTVGDKTAVELSSAKAAYEDALSRLAENEEEVTRQRLALKKAMGIAPEIDIALQDFQPLQEPTGQFLQDVLDHLEDRRLDLLALRAGYESQEEKVREAILSQIPRIGIGFTRARDTGDVITSGLALTIDIPLFDRNQGQIAIERATRRKLRDEYGARLFEARYQVAESVKYLEATKKRLESARRALESEMQLLESYRQALEYGAVDILTYYRERSVMLDRKLAVIDLEKTISDLIIAIEAASGTYVPLESEKGAVNVFKSKEKRTSGLETG